MNILMVCLGNICRSPLAQGILEEKIRAHDLDWQVDSAGTGSWHAGEQPDSRSVAVARKYGINITGQRARQIEPADFERFDLIFTMDESNYKNVLNLAPNEEAKEKVRMMMQELQPEERVSVPDPYWNDDGFEQVYQMLSEACDAFLERQAKAENV